MILTFPLTILTLGLFLLVVNAGMLGLTAWLLRGFHVADFGAALLASLHRQPHRLAGIDVHRAAWPVRGLHQPPALKPHAH